MKKEEEPRRTPARCMRCNTRNAVYHRMNINLCRRCFREMAPKMGFKKYR